MKRLVTSLAVVIALGAAACGSSGRSVAHVASPGGASLATGSASATRPSLTWHSCPSEGSAALCSMLSVPLNYADPSGRKIQIALSEVPATAPASQRQGVLLVIPGGPGGPGLYLAAQVANSLEPAVASEYTIVSFDPRGVGSSVPQLTCDPSFFAAARPDYVPASAADEQVLENRAKTYADDCEKSYGWLLPYMTTEDSARDMDSIRAALGVTQMSFMAYSYGTYLGQVYATLFPHQVRRMALDSVVDPKGVWWTDNLDQDGPFQVRQDEFFAWIASHDSDYHLGSTAAQVSASYNTARARLKAHPIAGPSGSPLVGADELDDTFLTGDYWDIEWPDLASELSGYLLDGATGGLLQAYQTYGAQNENEFAVYNAVECSDVNWPRSWTTWDTATRKAYATAPFLAWSNTWFNAACAFWPVTGPSQPLQIKGAGLPPILMMQGTGDPATPYAGAQVAHSQLPSSRMVVVEGGDNHDQSLTIPANTCVDNYLNDYLATGAVPDHTGPVSATCPALPPPV